MKRSTQISLFTFLLLWLGVGMPAFTAEIVNKEDFTLHLDALIQPLVTAEGIEDPYQNDLRAFHFLKRARLALHGDYEDFTYRIEMSFAGQESEIPLSPTGRPTWGLNPSLLDFYFDAPVPLVENVKARIGQFKTPYSRERMTYAGSLLFAERSVSNLFFGMGRDLGGAIYNTGDSRLKYGLSVQAGVGRNVPERFLPEKLGFPMMTARVGYNWGLDKNVFEFNENHFEADRPRAAVYVNALFTKDTLAGHSSGLNVRSTDKSLLINSTWNPFIAQRPLDQGFLTLVGTDFAFQAPFRGFVMNGEAEMNYGKFQNDFGKLDVKGGRIQTTLYKFPFEVGMRYSFVLPDKQFGQGLSTEITNPIGSKAIHEITPMITLYYKGKNAKLVVDFPFFINAPMAVEDLVGAYVLTEQPDQISVIRTPGNDIYRGTVKQIRALLQLGF
jgi:hypothetical protein